MEDWLFASLDKWIQSSQKVNLAGQLSGFAYRSPGFEPWTLPGATAKHWSRGVSPEPYRTAESPLDKWEGNFILIFEIGKTEIAKRWGECVGPGQVNELCRFRHVTLFLFLFYELDIPVFGFLLGRMFSKEDVEINSIEFLTIPQP